MPFFKAPKEVWGTLQAPTYRALGPIVEEAPWAPVGPMQGVNIRKINKKIVSWGSFLGVLGTFTSCPNVEFSTSTDQK